LLAKQFGIPEMGEEQSLPPELSLSTLESNIPAASESSISDFELKEKFEDKYQSYDECM
jgi:hypothetical protein